MAPAMLICLASSILFFVAMATTPEQHSASQSIYGLAFIVSLAGIVLFGIAAVNAGCVGGVCH